LFGHGRGAFTGAVGAKPGKFELADGGTILLDEIGEMPLHLQPKLLRALQEREFERLGEGRSVHVDIRVIATTNVSLAQMVERGQFRGDLYYRLNVIPLSLPPLRDRREDIPILAEHFARKYAAQLQAKPARLHPEFLELLQSQTWAGNVRELANFMRRVLTLSDTLEIDANCFNMEFQAPARPYIVYKAQPGSAVTGAVAGTPIRQMERLHLENTLALTDGNRTHAAEMLGISLRTLRNKIREYGLPPRRYA
jgi:transcriptional regulator with GAF, ATPase, and Fis domain